ncbi:hypothetical protein [Streptomyces sp. NPDC012888]|uniref:hypothetical protein n=1 Tax=Streptomyces sp. NPDC012888 TaxID=3364855 RepID=UPI0036B15713
MTQAARPLTRPDARGPDPEERPHAAPAPSAAGPGAPWWRGLTAPGRLLAVLHGAMLLLVAAFTFMIVRLPWIGDMGVHAATIERLRHDLTDPGNPMVNADTTSPYYSPWMFVLGVLAKATGFNTFNILRFAAVVGLALLLTGIWHFTRTLTRHRAAPPLAVFCVMFLWGPQFFVWSGFLAWTSLSLNVSYPSTFTTGLGFHFLALLTKALRRGTDTGWAAYTGLGLLWAVIMLSHQFSGVVVTFGAMGVLAGARPWPAKGTWLKLGAALAAGLALLALWPYYSFFSLFSVGGLEDIHWSLYNSDLFLRYCFALIGVAALASRWWKDRRDPLVVWFLLALAMVVAGGLLEKWSWGRAEPAVVIPAQIAAAVAVVESGKKLVRVLFGTAVGIGLVFGVWAQNDAFGFILRKDALPKSVTEGAWQAGPTYYWTTKYAEYGDVFMTDQKTAEMLPGYGGYTIVAGYPDFFLPDEQQRAADTKRYFDKATPRRERLDILHRYGADWVLQWPDHGGLPADDPALRKVKKGPNGQVLYKVVG